MDSTTPYDGPERRDTTARSRFDAAVAQAARDGAALALKDRRPRLVGMVLGAGAAVALLFLLIWWFAIARPFSEANAVYDCHLFTHAASLLSDSGQHLGQFVTSDANLRERQNKQSVSGTLGRDFQKIIDARTLARLAAQQHADVAHTIAIWRVDAGAINHNAHRLSDLAGTDCLRHLGG